MPASLSGHDGDPSAAAPLPLYNVREIWALWSDKHGHYSFTAAVILSEGTDRPLQKQSGLISIRDWHHTSRHFDFCKSFVLRYSRSPAKSEGIQEGVSYGHRLLVAEKYS